MPSQIPEWLRESVIRELDKTVGGRGWWCDSLSQRTIARLLWQMGEPEPVDPDALIVRAILHAHQRTMTPPDSGWGDMSYLKGSYDHLDDFKAALAAYKAEKART